LRVGAPLLAFRKSILTLEGVLYDIAADVHLDRALLASFLPRLIGESPWRAMLPLQSRLLPSRVCNADLAQIALALPCLALLGAIDSVRASGRSAGCRRAGFV
jgi:hypothetical protein